MHYRCLMSLVCLTLYRKYSYNCSKQNLISLPLGTLEVFTNLFVTNEMSAYFQHLRDKRCYSTPCNPQDSRHKIKLSIAPTLRNPALQLDHFSPPPLLLLSAFFFHLNGSSMATKIVSILTSV